MIRVFVGIIRFYQRAISRFLPSVCRFHPTCSSYAIEALEQHGLVRGTMFSLSRILRCHPFHPGGFDPIPPKE